MFELKFTNSCLRDFGKISRDAQIFIRSECFLLLQNNPHIGQKLVGKNFNNIFKLKTKFQRTEYRIFYRIDDNELVVLIIMIASRENVYKKLGNRIG